MLSELKTSRKLVGMKQIRRALQEGKVQKVFLAADADPALTEPLAAQCEALGIPVCPVPSMVELGAACEIDVKAAAAAIVSYSLVLTEYFNNSPDKIYAVQAAIFKKGETHAYI